MHARSTAIAPTMWALAFALYAVGAAAEVPPHTPGTICYTQNFWCWAQPPGPPGSQCACKNSSGAWVAGIRG